MRFFGALAVLGPVFLIIGLVILFQNLSLTAGGVETEGMVIGSQPAAPFGWGSKPKVFFRVRGEFITFHPKVFTPFTPSLGERVRVFYQPDDPTKAEISSFLYLWFVPIVFLTVGMIGIFCGALILYGRRGESRGGS